MRVIVFRAFLIALLAGLLPISAKAADSRPPIEVCPAGPSEIDAITPSLYSFDVVAPTPRTVRGTLAFETDAGWFRVPFGPIKLEPAVLHLADLQGHKVTQTSSRSLVQYVNFARPVKIKSVFMESAAADVLDWASAGLFQCSPRPGRMNDFEPIGSEKTPYASIPAGTRTISAIPVPPILRTDCAAPFVDAKVVNQAQAIYPFSRRMGPATSMVKITLDPSGQVVDARVFKSSGYDAFDIATLDAAKLSKYSPRIAYCRPVVSEYIFKVTFQ